MLEGAVDFWVERGPLSSDRDGPVHPRWAATREPRRRASSFRYLLDIDLDLADALEVRVRLAARQAATALTFDADTGEVELDARLAEIASGPGILVLDGVLAVNVRVGDRIAAELIGPGDLIEPPGPQEDELLVSTVGWRALVPVRFAILDSGFAERVRPWPQIVQTLLRRSERRARSLNVQRAISSQPRLDARLALLLWHLASRWGRVEPGGIRLPLPLTHQLLGRLVGAERPSVSHALARLARSGLVTGHGGEWHLHGNIAEQLECMVEPMSVPVSSLVDVTASRRQ